MWEAKSLTIEEIDKSSIDSVLVGKVPALIIKGFYSKFACKKLLDEIKNQKINEFNNNKLNHFGPFLMAYTTNKTKYFQDAKKTNQIFNSVFDKIQNPMQKIHEMFKQIFPKFEIAFANENHQEYSKCVIRIHEKGKKIPIHKDNVTYEGKEYNLSNIGKQLSCVLHLQKSESGGELTVYDKQWTKKDEKNREIMFGYTDKVISNCNTCKISNINQGDMVIINPNYFHSVSEITGKTPRVTLGTFLGFYLNKMKVVSWA